MIKIENISYWGFEHAVRGMRNPLNSWSNSDSIHDHIGDDDLALMKRLYEAGPEHRKYLRQIFVSLDITAPLYWWKEFDTYKVGTVSNSCSTMHKIAAKEFTLDDFSHEHLNAVSNLALNSIIFVLNSSRNDYLQSKNKDDWWQLIQLLPTSYNQKRTITLNYENIINMIHQRKGHKLDEWNIFVKQLITELPYIEELIEYETEVSD